MELLEREPHLEQLDGASAPGRRRAGDAWCSLAARPEWARPRWSRSSAARSPKRRRCCGPRATRSPRRVRSVPCATSRPRSVFLIDQTPSTATLVTGSFGEVLAAFAARPEPTVIVAEDAHWSDGASLELLRFLGRRIGGLPVLFVVTYRDDEIGADHPLRLVLGDLATAPAVHRISVRPLSAVAVQRLAEGSGRDAATLHRLTGGNPFFLTEALAAEGETVPATVGDAILARAARLSPEARAVLDIAAVIGSTIDPDLLLSRRRSGPRRSRRVHQPWLAAGNRRWACLLP